MPNVGTTYPPYPAMPGATPTPYPPSVPTSYPPYQGK